MAQTENNLSVVMTTFNRSALLTQTLNSLVAANVNGLEWELIVVDNDSTDNTAEVLDSYGDRLPLRIFRETQRGYAKAKNCGLRQASGRLIVFTDDDVIVDPQWLRSLQTAAQRWPDAGVFGGHIQALLPNPLPRWLQSKTMQDRIADLFGNYNPETKEGPTDRLPIGANLAFRASAAGNMQLDETRGANGSGNYLQSAEIDFIRRLANAGSRVIFVPDARVQHIVRPEQLSIESLNARAFRRGRNSATRDTERYANRTPIGGAPVGLWLAVAKLRLRTWALAPLGKRARYHAEDKLAFKRGALYQLRSNRRSAGGRSPSN